MSHEEIHLHVGAQANEPAIGETTIGLGEHLLRTGFFHSKEAFLPLREDALNIIRQCRPFHGPDGRRTGLVVGYVQSGKTASMTCVSALARDNGCRLIIVLAGVTTLLLGQNTERFEDSLRAASSAGWRIYNSDKLTDLDVTHLRASVHEWKNPMIEEADRQTVLFMVLKHHVHLDRVRDLLQSVDLKGVPALVIDDEADQAGLNTSPNSDPSTNYSKIDQVRQALPHHTYLQYTATPQAPLLIKIDDWLSPEFAELVRPGKGYTGGKEFFGADAPLIIREIPEQDQFAPGAPPSEVPDSLMSALRMFFLGSAVEYFRNKNICRSMLVHPSARKVDHAQYLTWITYIVKRWSETLAEAGSDDQRDLLAEFRDAYDNDLATTDHALPPFDDIVPKLALSFGRVNLKEVNSEDGSEVNWKNSPFHILVGGEKLNRGFTVEGLTVTYMPRGPGGFNADTLQQRARFFGYKQKYLGLCRLYLHPEVTKAFRDYVTHEEDVRAQLEQHRGRPLSAWRRAFFLSKEMRPTRRSVLTNPEYRLKKDDEWLPMRYPHLSSTAIASNRKLVEAFEAKHTFAKAEPAHESTEIALSDLMQEMLIPFAVEGADAHRWYGELLMLSALLEKNPTARAVVFSMPRDRKRALNNGAVAIFQGASSAKGKTDAYLGDQTVCDGTAVTVQIHRVNVKDDQDLKDIPALAVHVPEPLGRDIYVQGNA